MAKMRARTRPWRAIISLVVALAAAGVAVKWGAQLAHDQSYNNTHIRNLVPVGHIETDKAIAYSAAAAFFLFGMGAAIGLAGKARSGLQPLIGQAHAGVVRYALLLICLFGFLVIALRLVRVPIGNLVVGGAVTGVLLGIAAQQSLANLFAGLVLLFARPFRVGDYVRFRSGALSGQIEGTVTDVSLTYVRLETGDGPTLLPNSQALAAAVLLPTPPAPAEPLAVDPLPANPPPAHPLAADPPQADTPAVPPQATQ
jgi:small-conductance mechanosensitive channel